MAQMPVDETKHVHQALRNLNTPTKLLDSPWLSSCVVAKHLNEHPQATRQQALKVVFTRIRDVLSTESQMLADILQGRFWEDLAVKEMLKNERPQLMSERNFHNRQSEAIQRFTYLLLEEERRCTQTSSVVMEPVEKISPIPDHAGDEVATTTNSTSNQTTHEPTLLLKPQSYASKWFVVVGLTAIIGIILLGSIVVQGQRSTTAVTPGSSAAPSLIDDSAVAKSMTFACPESQRRAAPIVDRFIREQGVSQFTVQNTDGILRNDRVRSLVIDRRGLWLGYYATEENASSGLGQYDKRTWADCNGIGGPQGRNINAVAVDNSGNLWASLEKAGVGVFDGTSWKTYTKKDGLPSEDVFGITIDKENQVWVSTWEGVAKFNGTEWSVPYTSQNNTLFDSRVHTVAFDSTGSVWVGHPKQGISYLHSSDGKWLHYAAGPNQLGGNAVRSIIVRKSTDGRDESVWVATADGGISKYEQDKWTVYGVADGLPDNDVEALALDKYNRVWAATAGGTVYFDGAQWIKYTTLNTLSIAFGVSCSECPFDDDHVWTGTLASGLTHSRVPYPEETIDIASVSYPRIVAPGEQFSPEITIVPRYPYQLREDRGDYLAVTSKTEISQFKVYKHIGVVGMIASGQPYKFVDQNTPIVAPQLSANEEEKTFTLTYRLWMYTRYTGPSIPITFTVRRPDSTSTPAP